MSGSSSILTHLTGTAFFGSILRASGAESLAVVGWLIAGAAIMFGGSIKVVVKVPARFQSILYERHHAKQKIISIFGVIGMAAIGASLAFAGVKGAQNDAIICSTHC